MWAIQVTITLQVVTQEQSFIQLLYSSDIIFWSSFAVCMQFSKAKATGIDHQKQKQNILFYWLATKLSNFVRKNTQ